MRIARAGGPSGPTTLVVTADSRAALLPGLLADLLALPLSEFRDRVETAGAAADQGPPADSDVLAPIDGHTEVWAAGVTYQRSKLARMAESEQSADVYDRVYDAERPELFFKSTAWRVVGTGRPIGVRADSTINVPEPELAVVINRQGEIVGYTIGNDVSSRSIEGENPLYLPQAKVYLGGCAIGPWITPAWEVPDPYALDLALTIRRDGEIAWHGTASTAQLHRRIDDLVEHLFRADDFPAGVILSTGTGLVPDLPFTLQEADVVRIEIGGLGVLENQVAVGKAPFGWLAEAFDESAGAR